MRTPRSEPVGIEYANSRIRGARSRLLAPGEFDLLFAEPDLEGFTRRLGGMREYAPYIEDARLTRKGLSIASKALQSSMSDAYGFVLALMDEKHREQVITFVGRWDVQDLKTVIRGKIAGVSSQEIINSLSGAGGIITIGELTMLAEAETIEDAVAIAFTLRMPYASTLKAVLAEYQLKEALSDFEIALDKAYVDWARERLRHGRHGADLVWEVLVSETDLINVITAMRMVEAKQSFDDPGKYFIEGGRDIDLSTFLKFAKAPDVLRVLELLNRTPYRRWVEDAQSAYIVQGTISSIERLLHSSVRMHTIRTYRRDSLGFGVALAYLMAKENEITNLRIIAHGKRYHVPESMVRKEIILV